MNWKLLVFLANLAFDGLAIIGILLAIKWVP